MKYRRRVVAHNSGTGLYEPREVELDMDAVNYLGTGLHGATPQDVFEYLILRVRRLEQALLLADPDALKASEASLRLGGA